MKEHNLGVDDGWGLIMDELTGLAGKIKEAIIRSLDFEYDLLSVKYSLILAMGYRVVSSAVL